MAVGHRGTLEWMGSVWGKLDVKQRPSGTHDPRANCTTDPPWTRTRGWELVRGTVHARNWVTAWAKRSGCWKRNP